MKTKYVLFLLAAAAAWGGTSDAAYTLHIDGRDDHSVEADLMLPLRAPAEALGYTVTWDNGKTVVKKDGTELTVVLGSAEYPMSRTARDGTVVKEPLKLASAPYLKNGTTYVPAELFASLLAEGQMLTASGETSVKGVPAPEPVKVSIEKKGQTTGAAAAEKTAPSGGAAAQPASGEAAAQTAAAAPEAPAVPAASAAAAAQATAGTANPFRDYGTLAEAEAAAGVSMTLPAEGVSGTASVYRAIPHELLEVIYQQDGEETMRLRKGVDLTNVSGDYNTYPTIKTIRVDDVDVRMKGSGNRVSLATWERDGHAYSASVASPVTIAEMMAIVRAAV